MWNTVDISEVSCVMENLLESADNGLRYKVMLWIDQELNRLLSGVQRLVLTGTGRGAIKNSSDRRFINRKRRKIAAFAGLRK